MLLHAMDSMSDRERAVLVFRYGLDGGLPLKLKAIGRRLGLTGECVRQIEAGAVRKLSGRSDNSPCCSASPSVQRAPALDLSCAGRSKSQVLPAVPGGSGRDEPRRRACDEELPP